MIIANFQLRQSSFQSNNRYANAKITASNGSILNTEIARSNSNSSEQIKTLIAYDYASNTSTRTYSLKVNRGHVNAHANISNAVIWAIELSAS